MTFIETDRLILRNVAAKDMGYIPSMESQMFGKWTTPATETEIVQATAEE